MHCMSDEYLMGKHISEYKENDISFSLILRVNNKTLTDIQPVSIESTLFYQIYMRLIIPYITVRF